MNGMLVALGDVDQKKASSRRGWAQCFTGHSLLVSFFGAWCQSSSIEFPVENRNPSTSSTRGPARQLDCS